MIITCPNCSESSINWQHNERPEGERIVIFIICPACGHEQKTHYETEAIQKKRQTLQLLKKAYRRHQNEATLERLKKATAEYGVMFDEVNR